MRRSSVLLPLCLVLAACNRSPDPPDASASPNASSSGTHVADPSRPSPKPAGPAELALVAPLVPGGELAGFQVRSIHAISEGVLVIVCAKDRSTVRLWIALVSETGPEPPARSGKYAVFYSARVDPPEADKLARALAAILDKHADVPVPPGMTAFVPAPIPI